MNLSAYFAVPPQRGSADSRKQGFFSAKVGCAKKLNAEAFLRESLAKVAVSAAPARSTGNFVAHALCAFCMLWLNFSPFRVSAEDLRIRDRSWNGLSELFTVAGAEGPVEHVDEVAVTQLTGDDALLVVHPTTSLPSNELAKFMRRGGRVAVADDFGAGRRFFGTFGMSLGEPKADLPNVLRNNVHLPIAVPLVGHTLADGVSALVTNYPQVLFHQTLTPVFGLSGDQSAVVLSGAVGSGRLVAISDASVFINNMMQFRGNRTFARNLIRFLRGAAQGGHKGRLLIADSATRWQPSVQGVRRPLLDLSSALDRASHVQLPKLAVTMLSIALAGLLLGMLATSLPKRTAYARRAYLQSVECIAGMAGRVNHYANGSRNLLGPLVSLRREIERQALTRLRSGTDTLAFDVRRALQERGEATLASAFGGFASEVDRLQEQTVIVSARHFSELVASGRRILADLEALSPQAYERHE
ncbi:MAG: hypothetical protein RL701_618 [Pseudomonadota bacterium]